ncbi:uncharacterized protein H6S33_001796 [Morchella sextelata]|uniref:uncharacterized protein n=1 Tax=Morchella sextelata TaxID=1174677 RepID=UPI001D03766D|nr:uncharacterized protein H6S33_001796 [Morchella sextelata]KAH0608662.1 hypothetical protein H6S33_001796 [Morchella sextelata]
MMHVRALYNYILYFDNLEVIIEPIDEASTAATPAPIKASLYSSKYLAAEEGEWEHRQLLASGIILFAMSPGPYGRYETYELLWLEIDEDDEFSTKDAT